ncbi:MAG: transposase [Mesorhizobium sp.]|nr:MAG: transposase [Mesorhizobium sp.]
MIAFPAGVKVWIAGGVTDMRCGMNSLALKVQEGLGRDPHGGEMFCFRGRKGDLIKILWHDGVGMSLYMKRLEAGKFISTPNHGLHDALVSDMRSWCAVPNC